MYLPLKGLEIEDPHTCSMVSEMNSKPDQEIGSIEEQLSELFELIGRLWEFIHFTLSHPFQAALGLLLIVAWYKIRSIAGKITWQIMGRRLNKNPESGMAIIYNKIDQRVSEFNKLRNPDEDNQHRLSERRRSDWSSIRHEKDNKKE